MDEAVPINTPISMVSAKSWITCLLYTSDVYKRQGKGSAFSFSLTLPYRPVRHAWDNPDSPEPAGAERLLVVDDCEAARTILQMCIRDRLYPLRGKFFCRPRAMPISPSGTSLVMTEPAPTKALSPTPVSYTHLDVYKRQLLSRL